MGGKACTTSLGFLHGMVVGMVFSFLFMLIPTQHIITYPKRETKLSAFNSFHSIIENTSLKAATKTIEDNLMNEELENSLENATPTLIDDAHLQKDNNTLAKKLESKIRILCWIMTCPQNLHKKAIHVKNTWGKRCNILLFMSSVTNTSFPTIGLNVSEGREHLTRKSMQAFRYIYENHKDKADWFLKADDDTFVIVENLRYFLKDIKTSDPHYFGHHFKVIEKSQDYYSGGAGYVLSQEALKRLYTAGGDHKVCRQDGGSEDVEVGKCMQNLGVKTANSTDAMGRSRFHCFSPDIHLSGNYPKWYYNHDANGSKKGAGSISDYAISFHYVSPKMMYALEFYVYHLRPYGIESGHQHLNVL